MNIQEEFFSEVIKKIKLPPNTALNDFLDDAAYHENRGTPTLDKKKMTAYMDENKRLNLKQKLLSEGISFSALVNGVIDEYLTIRR